MQIRAQVKQFVIENFLYGQANGLKDEDSFLESGIVDSTGVLELIGFVEETYRIRVENDELTTNNFDSIRNVCEYVSRKLAGEARESLPTAGGAV